jgi:hypothetical protein
MCISSYPKSASLACASERDGSYPGTPLNNFLPNALIRPDYLLTRLAQRAAIVRASANGPSLRIPQPSTCHAAHDVNGQHTKNVRNRLIRSCYDTLPLFCSVSTGTVLLVVFAFRLGQATTSVTFDAAWWREATLLQRLSAVQGMTEGYQAGYTRGETAGWQRQMFIDSNLKQAYGSAYFTGQKAQYWTGLPRLSTTWSCRTSGTPYTRRRKLRRYGKAGPRARRHFQVRLVHTPTASRTFTKTTLDDPIGRSAK